jgi:hypothetical protein
VGEGGGGEVGLPAVAEVDGRLADGGLRGDAIDAHASVALGGQEAKGGVEDRGVDLGRPGPAGAAGMRRRAHGN